MTAIVGAVLVVRGAHVRDQMALHNAAGQAPPLLANWDLVVGPLGRLLGPRGLNKGARSSLGRQGIDDLLRGRLLLSRG